MAPASRRIAQTSTEAKKIHRKSGPHIPDRQRKQLERAVELEQRAARLREADERRKAAKKKREEKEQKEVLARKQMGVGLATQLIGYNHTQAQLKNGMEAFLGLQKPKDEKKLGKEINLTRVLDHSSQEFETELWDEDGMDIVALNRLEPNTSFGVDDDLDDDALLEAHDSLLLTSVGPAVSDNQSFPLTTPLAGVKLSEPASTVDHTDFVRLHGPVNKAIEATLDKLNEPLVEILSQDSSMKTSDWDPLPALLHKLNPVGIPPHRLRLKAGCVLVVMKDLDSSSQLLKSQRLRFVRLNEDQLECSVMDGQREGTGVSLTRVAFSANYKNHSQYPFQRIQFPVRVSVEHTASASLRDVCQSGHKTPTITTRQCRPISLRLSIDGTGMDLLGHLKPLGNMSPPTPKSSSLFPPKTVVAIRSELVPSALETDGWDDLLDSGTQIARELATETPRREETQSKIPNVILSPQHAPSFLSTQDLEFSMDDLNEDAISQAPIVPDGSATRSLENGKLSACVTKSATTSCLVEHGNTNSKNGSIPGMRCTAAKASFGSTVADGKSSNITILSRSSIPPARRPPSVSDRPGLKRKAWKSPHGASLSLTKTSLAPISHQSKPQKLEVSTRPHKLVNGAFISTQEATFFLDKDEDLHLGSPPIQV